MPKNFCVYMVATCRNGSLYIGVTSDLVKRVWRHREGLAEGFTKEHSIERLVWFEQHGDAIAAITREKRLRKWNRAWKIRLIEETNPYRNDLYPEIVG